MPVLRQARLGWYLYSGWSGGNFAKLPLWRGGHRQLDRFTRHVVGFDIPGWMGHHGASRMANPAMRDNGWSVIRCTATMRGRDDHVTDRDFGLFGMPMRQDTGQQQCGQEREEAAKTEPENLI